MAAGQDRSVPVTKREALDTWLEETEWVDEPEPEWASVNVYGQSWERDAMRSSPDVPSEVPMTVGSGVIDRVRGWEMTTDENGGIAIRSLDPIDSFRLSVPRVEGAIGFSVYGSEPDPTVSEMIEAFRASAEIMSPLMSVVFPSFYRPTRRQRLVDWIRRVLRLRSTAV